jgi:hypothetical protein
VDAEHNCRGGDDMLVLEGGGIGWSGPGIRIERWDIVMDMGGG